MALAATTPQTRKGLGYAVFMTVAMAATVGSALGFEHIGGYIPCALCLLEREPYYYGVPIGILAIGACVLSLPTWIVRLLLVILGIMMLVGAGMGVYHSGVEWGFWPGPTACGGSTAITTNAGNLLGDLNTVHGPSCADAALRVLGLSFAGWNVVASVFLAAVAFIGAKKAA
ncbi:disulfide bond formation protein B [Neorhizobium sp. NCHU2750]|uniref:disulfide bond formation protein B n=1 Tax=Neorhizobium sp. NCHU2750 TaxID=1825976 RepID=UPI000E717D28|nr:membrane protein [Neorhizobium sp. NCHU2750]